MQMKFSKPKFLLKSVFGLSLVIPLLCVFLVYPTMAQQFRVWNPAPIQAPRYIQGEIVVKFKSGVNFDAIEQFNQRQKVFILETNNILGFMRLRIPAGKSVEDMVSIYTNNPDVEYAEPNFILTAHMVPNDPLYHPYQWHLYNPTYGGINMEAAWDISAGSPAVIVAVLDTGVAYEDYGIYFQAPDLAGTTFVPGYDFINNDEHPNDDNSHGTHVTGTIAQATNNSYGVAGVAFQTAIMPVKVLDGDGNGSDTNVANGIQYATDNGAKVINMSLGGSETSSLLADAVAYAYSNGVTIIASTGNDGVETVGYPAAYEECIAVGATRYDESIAPYSNYGSEIELVAPGGDVTVDQNGDGYDDGILQETINPITKNPAAFGFWFFQGTSMAAPHVSGVAALVIAYYGDIGPDNVRQKLQSTAEDHGAAGWDKYYGWGIVDAYKVFATPDIAVTPSSYDYGNVIVDVLLEKTFVVKNEGDAPLVVNSTTVVGSNPADFPIISGGGFNLIPGATQDVVVGFKPQSVGSKSAILRFDSNDPDENPQDVPLQGYGVKVSISACGIDATSQDLIEDILGVPTPTGYLASAGVPNPNGEDGSARSQTHYYYTTNGGPNDTIYKIDLTGNLVGPMVAPNTNLQGLAYVDNVGGTGQDKLYGLDIIGSQLIEFEPNLLAPTGVTFPIPDVDRACAGGNGRLFVQTRPGPGNELWEIDPTSGATLNVFPTPNGGNVLFDGLAFDGNTLIGSEVVYPNSNLWLIEPNTGAPLAGPNPITDPYWFAALCAVAEEHTVTITSVTADPTIVCPDDVVQLNAEATDNQGHNVNYSWKIEPNEGAFDNSNQKSPQWTAPASCDGDKIYTFTVTATCSVDENVKDTDTVEVILKCCVCPLVGDVSGDGTISAYDAALILQFVVGIIDQFPVQQSPITGAPPSYSITVPHLNAAAGNKIEAPIIINDASNVTSGGITLRYDPKVLRAVNVMSSSLLSGYYWQFNTDLNGEVRIAFAGDKIISGDGVLFYVEFEALNKNVGKVSPLILETSQISANLDITKVNGSISVLPTKSTLLQNYPNPFNPETWFPYLLVEPANATLKIYSTAGELVRTLNLGHKDAGIYLSKNKAGYWNGKDERGESVASGVYFYSLQAGSFTETRKMIVVK